MSIHTKHVCLIGAGSTGIAAAKALFDAKVPFDCFEKGDRVGGNWVVDNINGMSSGYESLHANTSRDRMQYADFPMPKSYPHFPHHSQMARYLDDYVEHFGFKKTIQFRTSVEHVSKDASGRWHVRTRHGGNDEERTYDAVIVANGHHWDPIVPEVPGTFDGRQVHVHHYKSKKELLGKRVVVVGMGNSAMDIAVEASEYAERTFLSARNGVYVIPKYALGRPLDQWFTSAYIPLRLRLRLAGILLRVLVGDMESYGLPKPSHQFGQSHPTISGRILDRLNHGAIAPKPMITELMGDRVRFADGSTEPADVIVYCTGYNVTFPFFDPDFVSAKDNELPLFMRVFHLEHTGLLFAGLLQPIGAIMPLAEVQGRLMARYLRGEYELPSMKEMLAQIEDGRRQMAHLVKSKRHTMEVDFDGYLLAVEREVKRGAKRALRSGVSSKQLGTDRGLRLEP